MRNHDCAAHDDSGHSSAPIVSVAAGVRLQVALVCLCECFP